RPRADDPPRRTPLGRPGARLLGYCGNWSRAPVQRYNVLGPDGLEDRRAANVQKPKLSAAQQAELLEALQKPRPTAGCAERAEAAAPRPRSLWRGAEPHGRLGLPDRAGLPAEGAPAAAPQGRHPPRSRPSGKAALARRVGVLRRDHPDQAAEVW